MVDVPSGSKSPVFFEVSDSIYLTFREYWKQQPKILGTTKQHFAPRKVLLMSDSCGKITLKFCHGLRLPLKEVMMLGTTLSHIWISKVPKAQALRPIFLDEGHYLGYFGGSGSHHSLSQNPNILDQSTFQLQSLHESPGGVLIHLP